MTTTSRRRCCATPLPCRRSLWASSCFSSALGISGTIDRTAGLVLLVPGGFLAAVGVLGILLHSLETLYIGGRASIKAAALLGIAIGALIGLTFLGEAADGGRSRPERCLQFPPSLVLSESWELSSIAASLSFSPTIVPACSPARSPCSSP